MAMVEFWVLLFSWKQTVVILNEVVYPRLVGLVVPWRGLGFGPMCITVDQLVIQLVNVNLSDVKVP